MKIVLMTCLATVALSTAAFADNMKMDVKPSGAAAMMSDTGSSMQMKPATAGSASAHSRRLRRPAAA